MLSGWMLESTASTPIAITRRLIILVFLRKGTRRLKQAQQRVSKRVKGSKNRGKARVILGKRHLKISRQRKDHAVKLARCVITSNDVVAYEDLRIKKYGEESLSRQVH